MTFLESQEELDAIAVDNVKFRFYTVKHITALEKNVSWMKRIMSPAVWLAIVTSLIALGNVILRVAGK